MLVYCIHSQSIYQGKYKHHSCEICRAEWFDSDQVPVIAIGTTEMYDVGIEFLMRNKKSN